MKIIKSTPFKKVTSDYGNFDFIPEEGYELRSYIDFESKLIVVEEFPKERPSGVPYSPVQFIVHPEKGAILNFSEYSKYFNYEPQEIISKDGRFKLEFQRIHDEKIGREYKIEKLIEIESGKVISSGQGIVFNKHKLKNALERHYDDLKRREQHLKEIAAQKTLEEHYELCKEKLVDGRFILGYYNDHKVYKLIYSQGSFCFLEAKKLYGRIENITDYRELAHFDNLDDFWLGFTRDSKWYLKYSPFKGDIGYKEDRIIAKFIISEANKIRKEGSFSQEEYMKLHSWENQVYTESIRRSEYQQYCSNCRNPRSFSARYPKSICGRCYQLITDKNGKKLAFFNTHFGGYGCQGYYVGTEPKEKYDSNICYIGDNAFRAQEARFGGIVIQKED